MGITTVKRWVDEGVLPAHKTAGGHRKLLYQDVLRLIRSRNLPHNDLSVFPEVTDQKQVSVQELIDQISVAVFAGQQEQIAECLHRALESGLSFSQVADEIISPTMEKVGTGWEKGKISVMQEHRATQAVTASLFQLEKKLERSLSSSIPTACGGAPETDPTALPSLMAKLLLLDEGWNAVNLGPHTPVEAYFSAMNELKPKLIWIAANHISDHNKLVDDTNEICSEAASRGISVIYGGRAFGNKDIQGRIRFGTYGAGMSELSLHAKRIFKRTKRSSMGSEMTESPFESEADS